jgi:coenzyme F420-0:L-glutamate ligase/coenzyme F420-1:gamma-L-glutamate ligase
MTRDPQSDPLSDRAPGPSRLEAWAVDGIGEVGPGDDLATLLAGALDGDLRDGDLVLVTSKVVSKAEGRVTEGDREQAISEETVRVVARRGPTRIVENRLGLVMAAAGVDASNVTPGHVVLLPVDPDASARTLRERLYDATGCNVVVVVTDTAGRAWRTGQTDIAIGLAGLDPLHDLAGATDSYGNPLAVTAPAVADELAATAELVTGKLDRRPVSVVRGLVRWVLPVGAHGPGARALLRPRDQDMFALGAREAVVAAVRGRDADCFGRPAEPEELLLALESAGLGGAVVGISVRVQLPPARRTHPDGEQAGPPDVRDQVVAAERARLIAHAHGWRPHSDTGAADTGDHVTLSPVAP